MHAVPCTMQMDPQITPGSEDWCNAWAKAWKRATGKPQRSFKDSKKDSVVGTTRIYTSQGQPWKSYIYLVYGSSGPAVTALIQFVFSC